MENWEIPIYEKKILGKKVSTPLYKWKCKKKNSGEKLQILEKKQ